jgi:hypothetical protein
MIREYESDTKKETKHSNYLTGSKTRDIFLEHSVVTELFKKTIPVNVTLKTHHRSSGNPTLHR